MSGAAPWWSEDRDPGDETEEEETEIVCFFDPDFVADDDELPDWAICPKGHFAWLRPSDGSLFCEHHECNGGTLYHESWTGERFPKRDRA